MADILPYLSVSRNYTEEDIAGKTIVLDDMTGMTPKEAEKLLKSLGLKATIRGTGVAVLSQLPGPGQGVPGNSSVILYTQDENQKEPVSVPDFTGMNRQQANDAAGELGLYILVTGNQAVAPHVIVTSQSVPKDTKVPTGTTIQLEFMDTGTGP